MKLAVIILAAGEGTRMKSRIPKVLHPLGGRPLIAYGVDTAWELSGRAPVVVVGCGADAVRELLSGRAIFVEQAERLGTGHATLQAAPALRGKSDAVLVLYADMPLITAESLQALVDVQTRRPENALSLMTLIVDDPRGFGRVLRGESGEVRAIIEEKDCTPEQREIRELNAGVYCFRADWLWDRLPQVEPSPVTGEYYLPELIRMAVEEGLPVGTYTSDDPRELIGINTRVHLAEAEATLRERVNRAHMLAGVTLIDPLTTYIAPGVTIGQDTVIWPNTILRGETGIGARCEIGPNVQIKDSFLETGCRVSFTLLEDARLPEDTIIRAGTITRKGSGGR
jgi:bifunctional UDP-N-acetylglucosamine pyrophosphorylase/glucosamine-1-phosphate N-acetyltransferase